MSNEDVLVRCESCGHWSYDVEFDGRAWICDGCWDDYHFGED